ncbi:MULTISPECIES: DUF421 domain-containing protein [Catenuloplanes]|uniref:Uncharacterized membrane protein YcaP (DUF421 family) n=1 Tax=Catenuloplanes niger TaxID=587534 RepID=A0AAE3ZZ56_9ACTN|nr:YetF domain-containing protein [Catenuloplanes niger]MDR7327516.1 uncharacterized membrane protein YcaP (DUF421 family) [Catenuloplanes niger]
MLLQLTGTWLSVRSTVTRRLLKSDPTLLAHRGRMLTAAMRRQRVTEAELSQAVRTQGMGNLSGVAAVVLETDGTLSVVPMAQLGDGGVLTGVDRGGEADTDFG